MLCLGLSSTSVILGAALVAMTILASPSFADSGGGNADEIPLVTGSAHLGSVQVRFPTSSPSTVDRSIACKDGYRYIQRNPNPENEINPEDSVPVLASRCIHER